MHKFKESDLENFMKGDLTVKRGNKRESTHEILL